MTNRMIAFRPVNRWLEPVLAMVIVGCILYALLHLYVRGYLPQPFFYDPFDMWMDWFNVADWAHDPGMYDTYAAVYPPLSFILMKAISLPGCYVGASGSGLTAYYARNCDWLGIFWIHFFYVLNVFLVAMSFVKVDRETALVRSVALSLGLPMLVGLERGQIMLVAFTCVVLGLGPLIRSARVRWSMIGAAINFKIYLIAALFPHLLRRRWRWFEGAFIATIAIYVLTFCMLGKGSPIELYENTRDFQPLAGNPLDIWLASTYNAVLSLADSPNYPTVSMIGSRAVEVISAVIMVVLRATQLAIVLAAAAAWLRPEAVNTNRLILLSIVLAMVTIDTQYYAVCVPVYFLFMEKWRGLSIKLAIIGGYILCFPVDYPIDQLPPLVLDTYIYGRTEWVTYYVMLGPFARPGILLLIGLLVSTATINDVWRDIRRQGWRTRWRFRRDAPIMVGAGTAIPPGGAKGP